MGGLILASKNNPFLSPADAQIATVSEDTPTLPVFSIPNPIAPATWSEITTALGPVAGFRGYNGPNDYPNGVPTAFPGKKAGPVPAGVTSVVLSFKPNIAELLSGSLDTAIIAWLQMFPANLSIFLTAWHEGEASAGQTPANLIAMHQHMLGARQRERALERLVHADRRVLDPEPGEQVLPRAIRGRNARHRAMAVSRALAVRDRRVPGNRQRHLGDDSPASHRRHPGSRRCRCGHRDHGIELRCELRCACGTDRAVLQRRVGMGVEPAASVPGIRPVLRQLAMHLVARFRRHINAECDQRRINRNLSLDPCVTNVERSLM